MISARFFHILPGNKENNIDQIATEKVFIQSMGNSLFSFINAEPTIIPSMIFPNPRIIFMYLVFLSISNLNSFISLADCMWRKKRNLKCYFKRSKLVFSEIIKDYSSERCITLKPIRADEKSLF